MGNDEQREELADKGWRAGETFFERSGAQPADRGGGRRESGEGVGGGDGSLSASEAGSGIVPEDGDGGAADVHLPASEADDRALKEDAAETSQSWPGSGGPGSFPPPG